MKKITLTNDFHKTEATVIPQPYTGTNVRGKGLHMITRKTVLRLRKVLCGQVGCQCGGTFGERGGAYIDVLSQDYQGNYIVRA